MLNSHETEISIFKTSFEDIPGLWGRFNRVRQVVALSLFTGSSEVSRNFNSFSWNGADEGIHDHGGSINGTLNGIKFSLTIEGTTVSKETQATIKGHFLSKDGREGAIEISFTNGKPDYEAYWFTCLDGCLRLEQVINPEGKVFEADKLALNYQNKAIIPGTNQSLELHIPNTLNL